MIINICWCLQLGIYLATFIYIFIILFFLVKIYTSEDYFIIEAYGLNFLIQRIMDLKDIYNIMYKYIISIHTLYLYLFLLYSIFPVSLNSTLFITLDLLILSFIFMYLSIMLIIYLSIKLIRYIHRYVNTDLKINNPFIHLWMGIIFLILFVILIIIAIIIIYSKYTVLINGGFESNTPPNNFGSPNNSGPNPPNNNFNYNSVSTVNFRDWEKDSYYPDSEEESQYNPTNDPEIREQRRLRQIKYDQTRKAKLDANPEELEKHREKEAQYNSLRFVDPEKKELKRQRDAENYLRKKVELDADPEKKALKRKKALEYYYSKKARLAKELEPLSKSNANTNVAVRSTRIAEVTLADPSTRIAEVTLADPSTRISEDRLAESLTRIAEVRSADPSTRITKVTLVDTNTNVAESSTRIADVTFGSPNIEGIDWVRFDAQVEFQERIRSYRGFIYDAAKDFDKLYDKFEAEKLKNPSLCISDMCDAYFCLVINDEYHLQEINSRLINQSPQLKKIYSKIIDEIINNE